MEASVMCELAAPVLQLEVWDIGNDGEGFAANGASLDAGTEIGRDVIADGTGISGRGGGSESWRSSSHRRLAVLQWVTARATECMALRAAVPALSLGATLLLGLPPAAAAACAPMLVTAHAHAALWGHAAAAGAAADTTAEFRKMNQMAGVADDGDFIFYEPLQSDETLSSGILNAHHSFGGLSPEHAQRVALLQTAHHLTLKCNGYGAAISMIADVIHVVSSTTDPVSTPAAASSTFAVLHLLASHTRRGVTYARNKALTMKRDEESRRDFWGDEVDRNTTRLGHLVVQTFDAAATMVVDTFSIITGAPSMKHHSSQRRRITTTTHEMSLSMLASLCCVVLSGANAALSSLVFAAMWTPPSLGGNGNGSFAKFDDVIRAAYQNSGRLGIAVDHLCVVVDTGGPKIALTDHYTVLKQACALLSSHRVALRAAAAMRAGARVGELPSSAPPPRDFNGGVTSTAHRRKKQRHRDANVHHWVDMAAEEPSSDEGGGGGSFDDDDDDAIFCVRPSGGGVRPSGGTMAGWDIVGGEEKY